MGKKNNTKRPRICISVWHHGHVTVSRHQRCLSFACGLKSRAASCLSLSTPILPTQTTHHMDPSRRKSNIASDIPIPRGFTELRAPNSRRYLVPDFLVEWTTDAWESEYRDSAEGELADRGVSAAIHCATRSNPIVLSPTRLQMNRASHWLRAKWSAHRTR